MSIELGNFEDDAKKAVRAFWKNRKKAGESQIERGVADQGTRSQVTAGKNMDGFSKLIVAIAKANGLKDAEIHLERAVLTLPGFFRPTKLWDILITCKGELVAAIELKSQVGPSFGNNFNNRTEEALGTATALLASPKTSAKTGAYSDLSSMTSLKTFLATFAGHCLATSSRLM